MSRIWAMPRTQRKRNWLFSLLVVNVAMVLLTLLQTTDTWFTSLLGANATAALALLVMPPLLERLTTRPRLLVLAIAAGVLFFAAVGCLIMLALPALSG